MTDGPNHDDEVTEVKFALLTQRVTTLESKMAIAEAEIANYKENRARLTGVVWVGMILSAVLSFMACIATIAQVFRS